VIHAGDAQWMTAGRGIQHEENLPAGTIAHTLQLEPGSSELTIRARGTAGRFCFSPASLCASRSRLDPLRHEHAGGNPASVRRLPGRPLLKTQSI
jgi:hypothetical protein